MQALAGFVRAPDLSIEPTGHAARKIRVTGYLLWDDEHNGSADVGATVRAIGANKYHQPWRSTAWEIHPAIKIEPLDGVPVAPAANPSPSGAVPLPSPSPAAKPTPAASDKQLAQPQFLTITSPVKIKILYGETIIPAGAKLRIVSRSGETVTVDYLDGTYAVPISSTDLR